MSKDEKQKFVVTSTGTFKHNGKVYKKGKVVELDSKYPKRVLKNLLEEGVLTELKDEE